MQTLKDGTIRLTWTDLGRPGGKGYTAVPSGGQLLLDDADLLYAQQYLDKGYEPEFFVRQSEALQGRYVVISRVRA
jgi:hypothetical protein